MQKRWLLGILWLVAGSALLAQSYWDNEDLFTTRNGLPNNMVLSLYQDHKGFLWIGTYNGLCRYDGKEIRTFHNSTKDSAGWINSVDAITEDQQHNLWVVIRGGLLGRLDAQTGKWKWRQTRLDISSIFTDAQNMIWLGTKRGMVVKMENEMAGEYVTIPSHENGMFGEIVKMSAYSKDSVLVTSANQVYLLHRTNKGGHYLQEKNIPAYRDIELVSSNGKQVYYFLENKKVFCYDLYKKQGSFIEETDITIHHHTPGFSNAGNLLMLKQHYLLNITPEGETIERLNLEQITAAWNLPGINCMQEDRSGLIWVGTHQGLLKIDRNRALFKRYTHDRGQGSLKHSYIRSVFATGNALWIGVRQGQIGKMTVDTVSGNPIAIHWYDVRRSGVLDNDIVTNTISQDAEGNIWAGGLNGFFVLKKNASVFEQVNGKDAEGNTVQIRYLWAITDDGNGSLLLAADGEGFMVFDKKTHLTITHKFPNGIRARNVFKSSNGQVWLTTSAGLFKANKKEGNYVLEKILSSKHELWDMTEDRAGNLWVGTTRGGVLRMEMNSGRTQWYTREKNDLVENITSGIVIDKQGKTWISTINGLSLLLPGKTKMINFSEEDGLLSNDFNFKANVLAPWGEIYLGTKSGLVSFRPEQVNVPVSNSAPLEITGLKVMGVDMPVYNTNAPSLELSHQDNNLSFRFSLLDFRRPYTHTYQYKLDGFDKQWQLTTQENPNAAYTNIPPGNYVFLVRATSDGANWITARTPVKIYIKAALWQRTYFWIIIGVVVVLITAAIIRLRILSFLRKEREKSLVQKKMAELEMTALRSQMNPHFIFNAIGAIQHYILKSDIMAANEYLARFARLMRLFLESARNKYITLEEEATLLELYLSLEKLRFEEKFTYEIKVDESLLRNKVRIPSMLIQPFAENAVQHGLVHLQHEGWLRINITTNTEETQVICVVEDNGIGRVAAAQLRKRDNPGHISRGMMILEERLKTFSEAENLKVTVEIEDKKETNGEAVGTRVRIYIPLETVPYKPYLQTDEDTYYR